MSSEIRARRRLLLGKNINTNPCQIRLHCTWREIICPLLEMSKKLTYSFVRIVQGA